RVGGSEAISLRMALGGDCFVALRAPRNDSALFLAPCPTILQRHPDLVVELGDELVEQREELGALGRGERREHARLGALRGRGEALEHALAGASEREAGAAAVARADPAADQPGLLELPDHHAGGRAVEAEQARHRDLVDAGPMPEREQDAVLP